MKWKKDKIEQWFIMKMIYLMKTKPRNFEKFFNIKFD